MGERILTLARAACGAAEEETALLETLCAAAETAWLRRLRRGVEPRDCQDALICAAALTAAADLAAGRCAGGAAAFTAGDVSVKGWSGTETARQTVALRQTAERLMAAYVQPADLCLKGVRG